MFNNINEALAWLVLRTKSVYGLADFKKFLASQGNPELKTKCLHIAGTNGKGSTTNYLRSIFHQVGYKNGSFTSPHLVVHNDRIRINNEMISDERLLAYLNKYYNVFTEYGLSMFEIDMFIACVYFAEEKVDYAMIEVGLGGELDATNVIDPEVSIITTIDYDHMQYLGNTLALIAKAKAGIIKPNRPCVSHAKPIEAQEVIKNKCLETNSHLYLVKEPSNIKVTDYLTFDYPDFPNIKLNTLALYQADNASTVLETMKALKDLGLNFKKEDIYEGLFLANWPGRFEQVSANPLVFLDGAHNREGIEALAKTVTALKRPCNIVFAALKDKETDKMVESLLKITKNVTVTQFNFYRDKPAKELAGDYPVKVIQNWEEALKENLNNNPGMVIITGSLYFISIVRQWFKEKK